MGRLSAGIPVIPDKLRQGLASSSAPKIKFSREDNRARKTDSFPRVGQASESNLASGCRSLCLGEVACLLALAQQAHQCVSRRQYVLAQEAGCLLHIAGPAFADDLAMLALGALAAIGIGELHAGEAVGALEQL